VSHPRNPAASVHGRLLNVARHRREELEYLLTRYALERLLYRLGISLHGDQFILKGAVLIAAWIDQPYCATRDLDLLGHGSPGLPRLEMIFRDLCTLPITDDGLVFEPGSVRAAPMREEHTYQGARVQLTARLGQARLSLQIDIGFGDAVTPAPVEIVLPTLLDLPAPRLRAYPRETVIAEKFQAMVLLGITNSRLKDFYDLWTLAQRFDFDGVVLARALAATFERRHTIMPTEPPLALTPMFAGDVSKRSQWRAFVQRGRLLDTPPDLSTVVLVLADFLMPPARALGHGQPFTFHWPAGGPWQ
jgi:hypothetical protein